MKGSDEYGGAVPVSRRNVLKASAIGAVGVGLFSGTASATNPNQINFCGCSQLCLDRPKGDKGVFYAITAEMVDDEWAFGRIRFGEQRGSDCDDVEGTDKKIIAVVPQVNPDGLAYCNPNQCARKALDVYLEENGLDCVNDVDDEPAFGTFEDIKDTPDNTVEIVRGRCGKPGRTPPGQDRD